MKLDFIEKVVDVTIRSISGNTNTSDLNTIMIVAEHTQFTAPELFRVYTSALQASGDGFALTSYVYNAVNIAFSQSVKPRKVLVASGVSGGKYVEKIEEMMNLDEGFLWIVTDSRDVGIQVNIAKMVESTEKYFVAVSHTADTLDSSVETDIGSMIKELQLNHTYAWFDDEMVVSTDPTVVTAPNASEIALIARCSSGIIGTVQFLQKELVGITRSKQIKNETHQNTLTAKGYTYLARGNGKNYSWGSGKVASGEWIDISLAITWITVNIRERLFALITSYEKLGYTNVGAAAIEAEVRSVLLQARDLGMVAADSQILVSVPDVTELTIAQRASRELPDVRFTCRLAGAIIAVKVNGEVYQ